MSLYERNPDWDNQYDPFIAPLGSPEPFRRKAYCRIWYDGFEVTDRLNPHLLSVVVMDKMGDNGPDEAIVEVDDRDARIPLPALGSRLLILLGWNNEAGNLVFDGTVEEVQSTFGRKQGGRRLFIHGTSASMLTAAKDPIQENLGEGAGPDEEEGQQHSFQDAMQQFGANSGFNIQIAPQFAGIMRDYWASMNESFYHYANRMAHELGGFVKTKGDTLYVLAPGMDVSGNAIAQIVAKWGQNLISWNIYPFVAKPVWQSVDTQFYDQAQAAWNRVTTDAQSRGGEGGRGLPFNIGASFNTLPHPAPNAGAAEQQGGGAADMSSWRSGSGHVVINGEPRAGAGMQVTVIGARPGVDGDYLIEEADHMYSREGYTTRLELWWPTRLDTSHVWEDSQGEVIPRPHEGGEEEPTPEEPPFHE